MSDAQKTKLYELRELARQLRLQADETQLQKYIELLRHSALELDRLAEQIEAELIPAQSVVLLG